MEQIQKLPLSCLFPSTPYPSHLFKKKKTKNPETIQLTIKTQIQINMYHNRNVIQYYILIFPTQCRVLIFIAYSSY